jgi:hypothetical protein
MIQRTKSEQLEKCQKFHSLFEKTEKRGLRETAPLGELKGFTFGFSLLGAR